MTEPTNPQLKNEIELTKKKDINPTIQTQLDELLDLVNQNPMNDVEILYLVLKINIAYYNIKKKYLSFSKFLDYFKSKDYTGLYIFILFLNKNKDQKFSSFHEFTYNPEQQNLASWQQYKNGTKYSKPKTSAGRGIIDNLIFFLDRINFYYSYFLQYNEVYPNLGFKDPNLESENVINNYLLPVLNKLTLFLENVNNFQKEHDYQKLIEILRSLSLIPETQLKKDERITINEYEKLCKCIDNNKDRGAAKSMVHIYKIDKWFRERYKNLFNEFVSQNLVECFYLFIFVPFFYTRLEVPKYTPNNMINDEKKWKEKELSSQSAVFSSYLLALEEINKNEEKFYPEKEIEKQVNENEIKKAQSLLILISLIPYGKKNK